MSEIILDSEELFKLQLLESIGEKYMCFKSQHKYSVIDFICINKNNLNNFYIEHKKRYGEKCNWTTLYIGFDKVNKINQFYQNCYYVWSFDNVFYWVKHNESFLQLNSGFCNGSKVYHIPVDMCNTTYETFIGEIDKFSNDRY